ncbi:hypothetical protein [Rhizobium sp. LjRoot258]
MSDGSEYILPKLWTWKKVSGVISPNINRPVPGPTHLGGSA